MASIHQFKYGNERHFDNLSSCFVGLTVVVGRVNLRRWVVLSSFFHSFRSSAPSFDSFILIRFILLSASFLPLLCLFVSSAHICYRELTAAADNISPICNSSLSQIPTPALFSPCTCYPRVDAALSLHLLTPRARYYMILG
jgi:hypothetical protein